MRLISKPKENLLREMISIGVSDCGQSKMLDKGGFLCLRVDGLKNPAALILKQELLSVGGDAALSRDAIMGGSAEIDGNSAILMATIAQLRQLTVKMQNQPFGLKNLAVEIIDFIEKQKLPPQAIKCRDKQLLFNKTLIMGILNITPDSFYDGGEYFDVDKAVAQALKLAADGADIIDIGAASSRPGHTPVTAEEEISRLLPALRQIVREIDLPISIDTDSAVTARAALEIGADIINDIGGLQKDIGMAAVAAAFDAPVIVMHSGKEGCYGDIIADISAFFSRSKQIAAEHGIADTNLIYDPGLGGGIGFGKNLAENMEILHRLPELTASWQPLLIGASNKGFIGKIINADIDKREFGNAAVTTAAVAAGAAIIRVHNVAAAQDVIAMADAIYKSSGDTQNG